MGNQTIVKYVTQMRGEEGVQKRILSFLFPENVILITFLSDRFRMPCFLCHLPVNVHLCNVDQRSVNKISSNNMNKRRLGI